MPGGDGTGPRGRCGKEEDMATNNSQGSGSGRGLRQRSGGGIGQGGAGKGRKGGCGTGPGGECICPKCKTIAPHTLGTPCIEQVCPNCGSKMTRA